MIQLSKHFDSKYLDISQKKCSVLYFLIYCNAVISTVSKVVKAEAGTSFKTAISDN